MLRHLRSASPAAGSTRPASTTVARAGFNVGLATCRLVDTTRTTFDYATGQTLPERVLVTEVRYPTTNGSPGAATRGAHPAYRRGPYPVIVFAPGYNVTPDTYRKLLDFWVRHGFVVAAPTFPDTNPAAVAAARFGDPEDDLTNQPGDVAFVTREVLRAARVSSSPCRVLHGLVDGAQVGLAGQSDGAETVGALAFDKNDLAAAAGLRYRAVAVMSGQELDMAPGAYGAAPGAPALLVVQSATDRCNPPQESGALYAAVPIADKWFLKIFHASHLGPYDASAPAAFGVVARVSTYFFAQTLHGRSLAGLPGIARPWRTIASVSTGPNPPVLPNLAFSKPACKAP